MKIKNISFNIIFLILAIIIQGNAQTPKSGPLTVCYVEVNNNGNNILNVGAYKLKNGGQRLFDIGIIFAANVNWDSTQGKAVLGYAPNVNTIMNNKATYIQPLQNKGIKVLLDVLGNHMGVGISNFTSRVAAHDFAQQCADAVAFSGLDGIDLDDEWAEYGQHGQPAANDSSFLMLVQELRSLMPGKIISLYAVSPAYSKQTWNGIRVGDLINYSWNPGYGSFMVPNVPPLGKSQLAPAAVWITKGTSAATAKSLAQQTITGGYGAFLTYDLHGYDESSYLSAISTTLYNDSTVLDTALLTMLPPTSKPVVDYSANVTTTSVGQPVSFTNMTLAATSYQWTFTGGTPATSTATNPVVTYANGGFYTVKLVATNANGSDSLIKFNYISVGKPGNYSLTFNGTNQSVYANSINLSGTAITMEGWVKPASFKTVSPYIATIMGTEVSTANAAILRFGDANIAANKLQFVLSNGTAQIKLSSSASFNTSTWYHLAATYDGTNMKLYVNGLLDTTMAMTGNFVSNGSFYLGFSLTSPRYFNGQLDEMRVWKRALSQTEIQLNMCGTNPASTGLEAYWPLNDGTLTANDTTGHAHTGSLLGMAINNWNTNIPVCVPVALPVANFSGSPLSITTGQSVTFANNSSNATSYSWTFTGGTPSVSTSVNPVVNYAAPGLYTVKLVVTNSYGSDSMTKTNYITVSAPAPVYYALSLSSGKITTASIPQLVNTNKFTFETWVKFNSIGAWSTLLAQNSTTYQRIMLQTGSSNNLYALVCNGSNTYATTAANSIAAGQWYHIAMVYDGTQADNASRLKLYINGVQSNLNYAGTIPATTSSVNTAPFIAGSESVSSTVTYVNGILDEIRVWNAALSQATINSWMNTQLAACHPYTSNLILYWPLDNNAGNTTAVPALSTTYTGTINNGTYVTSTQATATNNCSASVPVVGFTGSPLNITTGQSVTFANSTVNATSYNWTFAGGAPSTSTITNPVITYSAAGTYTVKLVAANTTGSDSLIRTAYITVTDPAVSMNRSISFNGTNQSLNAGTINLSGNALSLEGWIKPAAFKTSFPYISSVMGIETAGNTALLRIGDANITGGNKLQFVVTIGTTQVKLVSNSMFSTNIWYHIAATYDGASMKLYVNGVLDTSIAQTGSVVANALFNIGNSYTDNVRYWNGNMDELRVWKRALTQAEIQANMCTVPVNSNSLEAYWKMNEGAGITTGDTTGHLHTAVFVNMTTTNWSTDVSGSCGTLASRTSGATRLVTGAVKPDAVGVYPNPVRKGNKLTINLNEIPVLSELTIFGSNGNVVEKRYVAEKVINVSTSGLASGIYYYNIRSNKGMMIGKGSFIIL